MSRKAGRRESRGRSCTIGTRRTTGSSAKGSRRPGERTSSGTRGSASSRRGAGAPLEDRASGKPGDRRDEPVRNPGKHECRHGNRGREVGRRPGGDDGVEHPHRRGPPFPSRGRGRERKPRRQITRRAHRRRSPHTNLRYTPSTDHDRVSNSIGTYFLRPANRSRIRRILFW